MKLKKNKNINFEIINTNLLLIIDNKNKYECVISLVLNIINILG